MKKMTYQRVFGVVLIFSLFFAVNAMGQEKEYPVKPINLWIGYSSGGAAGLSGTIVAEGLKKYLKQPVLVNFKPGASQLICAEFVSNSPPDGYTLFWVVYGELTGKVVMEADKIKFRLEDLDMTLGGGLYIPFLLGCNAESPWKTIEDVIAAARKSPGKLTLSNFGPGSGTHVLGLALARKNGIVLNHIPFAGGGPAIQALLGGHIDMHNGAISTWGDHIQPGGKLRGLLLFDHSRVADVPDVPTSVEKGFLTLIPRYGFAAPKGLPEGVKATLAKAIKDVLGDPEIISQLAKVRGLKNEYLNPEQLSKMVQEDKKIFEDAWKTIEKK